MKKIHLVFLLIGIIVFGIGYFIIRIGDAATGIAGNLAAIEAARAAQDAAEAAKVASSGLATVSVIQSLILAAIVLATICLVALVVSMALDQRARNAQTAALLAAMPKRRWAPGPNARFAKAGDLPELPQGTLTEQMLQFLLAQQIGQYLGQMQRPLLPPTLPFGAQTPRDEVIEDDSDLWGE